MTEKDEAAVSGRRNFLKLATVAAPAAAVAVTGKAAAAAEPDDQAGKGLRDTAHVRAYYDSARF
jgi:type IV secretory pathway protease TraF